jgi:hypothetical protein
MIFEGSCVEAALGRKAMMSSCTSDGQCAIQNGTLQQVSAKGDDTIEIAEQGEAKNNLSSNIMPKG